MSSTLPPASDDAAASATLPADLPASDAATELAAPSGGERNYTQLLVYWLAAALLVRLFIIVRFPNMMFTLDVNTFRSWGDTIIKVGPTQFYANTWSDYPPLFMYFLWLWGYIQYPFTHNTMMSVQWAKLPGCLADIVNSILIFQLLKGRVAIRSAFRTAVLYSFNPVVLFVSAVWGQVDAIITTMMLLVSLAVLANRLIPAAMLSAAAVLIKPQGVFLAPVVFGALWHKHPVWKWPVAIGAGVLTAWLALLPATWTKLTGTVSVWGGFNLPAIFLQPFYWLNGQMQATANNYPHSTVNAFNIWMLPAPNEAWKPDDRMLFFMTHINWGRSLCALLIVLVCWYLYRNRHMAGAFPYFLAGSVTLTGFYMVATRMHERYIFPAIAFLALAAACNRRLSWLYWAFSATSFLSITYIYFFYNDQSAWVEGLKQMMNNGHMLGSLKLSGMVLLSLVNVWLFGELLSFLFIKGEMVTDIAENRLVMQFRTLHAKVREQAMARIDWLIPLCIAGVFFTVALIRLGTPGEQIFDEVYHARTAMEYIKGISPYEWTHPPLAKLIAALGILTFGGQFALDAKTWTVDQAFAWRFTSVIFGSLTLVVTFALARSLFANRMIATAATILLALDGVFFVQSRVAMTNIYEVFFIMLGTLGTWLCVKRQNDRWLLLTGLGLGCALATRWSSLYAWGLTGLFLIWYSYSIKRRVWVAEPSATLKGIGRDLLAASKGGIALWVGWVALTLGLIPVVIYLLTYIPYLLQGDGEWAMKLTNWNRGDHSWLKVFTWQKDMWGYHANLNATHPYSSPWWSWPIMLRPTWYYFHDWKDIPGLTGVSGIWAIGNAFIWWASIPALLYSAYLSWRDRLANLGLLALMGIGLWAMWGVQPRPLLYMHYMFESIPFACIALSYIGYMLWNGRSIGDPDQDTGETTLAIATDDQPESQANPYSPWRAGQTAQWALHEMQSGMPLSLRARRMMVCLYIGLVVAWFAFYYPLLAAVPVPWSFYNWHIWFGRAWI